MKGILSLSFIAVTFCPGLALAFTGNDIYEWGVQFEKENGSPVSVLSFSYVGYVSGAMDSMNQVLFCAPKSVTYSQAASVVMKYLRENPEERNRLAPTLIISAMSKPYPCPK